jgi:hypothetical protein
MKNSALIAMCLAVVLLAGAIPRVAFALNSSVVAEHLWCAEATHEQLQSARSPGFSTPGEEG